MLKTKGRLILTEQVAYWKFGISCSVGDLVADALDHSNFYSAIAEVEISKLSFLSIV